MKRNKPLPQIITELQQFFAANGLNTSAAISRETNLNQSQIYRNLFGTPKRLTKTHLTLCLYAKIDAKVEAADPRSNAILMGALTSIWDGSDDHARRLADLLIAHSRASVGR